MVHAARLDDVIAGRIPAVFVAVVLAACLPALAEAFHEMQMSWSVECLRTHTANPRLIVLMPPKTASRHLASILEVEYGRAAYMERKCPTIIQLHSRPPLSLEPNCSKHDTDDYGLDGLTAKERWDLVEQQADRRTIRFVGLVRDPVEFWLSYYSFVRANRSEGDWKEELHALLNDTSDNSDVQLAFFAGKRQEGPQFACPNQNHIRPTREDLERVQRRVSAGQLLVGSVEHFGAAMQRFAAVLDWRRFDSAAYKDYEPRGPDKANVDSVFRSGDRTRHRIARSQLPAELLEAIERKSRLDRQLHNLALHADAAYLHTSSASPLPEGGPEAPSLHEL